MTGWRRTKLACVLAACGILAAGCGGSPEQPSGGVAVEAPAAPAGAPSAGGAAQGVSIEFASEPDPPASGDNAIRVKVTNPDGSPVTDATVNVVFSMPAMPSMNMPAMRSAAALEHEAAGVYRGTGQLSMAGTWSVSVTAARGSDEIASRRLSVVAK